MWLTLLLVGVFATLTSACVFPFNNPRLTNDSLVADYVADVQAKYGDGVEDGGGNGWVTVISQGTTGPVAWPDNGKHGTKLTNIYYCYASHDDFTKLKDVVIEAAAMWRDKLGAGHQNEHRFDGFHIYWDRKSNSHPRCYNDYTDKSKRTWNTKVPEGTLVIESRVPESGSWATLGYRDKTVDADPDRHKLEIGQPGAYKEHWTAEVVHELGHVLGLVHEHQRKDRNQYVNFDCSKLKGYDDVKSKIESHKEWGMSIDEVSPSQYSLVMGSGRKQTNSLPYDHESIMQYSSVSLATNDQTKAVKDLPLVRWKSGRPKDGVVDESSAEFIYLYTRPSNGDKEAIQKLYPWKVQGKTSFWRTTYRWEKAAYWTLYKVE